MIALGKLKAEIRKQIWASPEAENLITQHDQMFLEGLSDIQKFIPCERQNNVNVIPFCQTYYKCGMTIVNAPRGVIHRLYTIANGNWCSIVFYDQKEWPAPECWARNVIGLPVNLASGASRLPLGYQMADISTDRATPCSRYYEGVWAIYNRNLYLAPWIMSNESVVIEWSGIKPGPDWRDEDLVSDATDFRRTLKLYVQWAHERDFGSDQTTKASLRRDYDEAFAELMWQCDEETKLRRRGECSETRGRTPGEIAADLPPVVVEPTPEPEPEPEPVPVTEGGSGIEGESGELISGEGGPIVGEN